jgi:hypothetical protein
VDRPACEDKGVTVIKEIKQDKKDRASITPARSRFVLISLYLFDHLDHRYAVSAS